MLLKKTDINIRWLFTDEGEPKGKKGPNGYDKLGRYADNSADSIVEEPQSSYNLHGGWQSSPIEELTGVVKRLDQAVKKLTQIYESRDSGYQTQPGRV